MKELKYELQETENFLQSLREDLRRLRVRKKHIMKYRPSVKHLETGATDKSVSDISDLSYFTSKSALLAK